MNTFGEKLAIASLFFTLVAIVLSIMVPEVREYFGLEKTEPLPIQANDTKQALPPAPHELPAEVRNSQQEVESPKPKQDDAPAEKARPTKKPETIKVNYIGNPSFLNTAEPEIAILILDDANQTEGVLSAELARKYGNQGMRATSNLFNRQFVNSKAFDRLYQGDFSDSEALIKHVDKVCLGKLRTSSRPSSQPDMIVVEAILETQLFDLNNESMADKSRLLVSGTGWTEDAARINAINKLVSKISNQ